MAATSPVGADVTRVYTSADFPVGSRAVDDASGKEYIFCSFAATTAATNWVVINTAGVAAAATTAVVGASLEGALAGVSNVAATAASWQWVQVRGATIAGCISGGGAAAFVPIFSTSTAGLCDDVVTSSYAIIGATLTEAEGATTAAQATVDLKNPRYNTATGATIVS